MLEPSSLAIGVYNPPIRITLEFATYEAASAALARLSGVIAPADRPDAGASAVLGRPDPTAPMQVPTPAEAELSAAQVFGGAAVLSGPPAAATGTAAAAPSINVPVVPPASSTVPSVPSAPAAPTGSPAAVPMAPAAPASPAGVEVDADGLPWDARIHAGGRAKNADGKWRQKRGLNDPALKQRVEAELRQAMAAGVPATVPTPPVAAAVPTPPVAPTAPVAPPAAPVAETFATLMVKITQAQAAGKLTEGKVGEALAAVQLSAPGQLAVRPELCPAVGAIIDGFIAAAG